MESGTNNQPDTDNEDQCTCCGGICVCNYSPLKKRLHDWYYSPFFVHDICNYLALLLIATAVITGVLYFLPFVIISMGLTIIICLSCAELAGFLWLRNWWKDRSEKYTWQWWSSLSWQKQLVWIVAILIIVSALVILNVYTFGFALGIIAITDFLAPVLYCAASIIVASIVSWIVDIIRACIKSSTPEAIAKAHEDEKKNESDKSKQQKDTITVQVGPNIAVTFSPSSSAQPPVTPQTQTVNQNKPTRLDMLEAKLSRDTSVSISNEIAPTTRATSDSISTGSALTSRATSDSLSTRSASASRDTSNSLSTRSASASRDASNSISIGLASTPSEISANNFSSPSSSANASSFAALTANSMSGLFSSPNSTTSQLSFNTPQSLQRREIRLKIITDEHGTRIITSNNDDIEMKNSNDKYISSIGQTLYLLGFTTTEDKKSLVLNNKSAAKKKREEFRKINSDYINSKIHEEHLATKTKELEHDLIDAAAKVKRPENFCRYLNLFLQTEKPFPEEVSLEDRTQEYRQLSCYNYRLLNDEGERNRLRDEIQRAIPKEISIHTKVEESISNAKNKITPATPVTAAFGKQYLNSSQPLSHAQTMLLSPTRSRATSTADRIGTPSPRNNSHSRSISSIFPH